MGLRIDIGLDCGGALRRRPVADPAQPTGRKVAMAKRIETMGLSCYYGHSKAVEDVNITIEPKSVTAFIGPSGCGKSTMLRSLNRMHEVIPRARIEGKVLLDDEDIYAPGIDAAAVRRTIGMVFQKPN